MSARPEESAFSTYPLHTPSPPSAAHNLLIILTINLIYYSYINFRSVSLYCNESQNKLNGIYKFLRNLGNWGSWLCTVLLASYFHCLAFELNTSNIFIFHIVEDYDNRMRIAVALLYSTTIISIIIFSL